MRAVYNRVDKSWARDYKTDGIFENSILFLYSLQQYSDRDLVVIFSNDEQKFVVAYDVIGRHTIPPYVLSSIWAPEYKCVHLN